MKIIKHGYLKREEFLGKCHKCQCELSVTKEEIKSIDAPADKIGQIHGYVRCPECNSPEVYVK